MRLSENGPQPEFLSRGRTEKIKSALVRAFTESINSRSLPRVPSLINERGEPFPVRASGVGKIQTEIEGGEDLIEIRTDSGLIVEGNQEMVTHEVTGCLVCFVFGENGKGKPISGLIHLTPSSELSWGNFRNERDNKAWGHRRRVQTAEKLASALTSVQAVSEKTTLVLIRNRGIEETSSDSGYAENELNNKCKDLAQLISENGFHVVLAEALPFVTASLYRNPEEPNTLLAVGENEQTHSIESISIPVFHQG